MATPEIKPIKQFAKAGDNYAGRGSSDGTHIYVPSATSGIATLSKYDLNGTLVWERNLRNGGSGTTSSAAPDGSILVASSSGGSTGKTSVLARFNSAGDKLWEATNSYPTFADVAISGGTVYVSGGSGTGFNSANSAFINAYSLENGTLLWSKKYPNSGASYIGDLEIVDGNIYVAASLYGKQDFDTGIAGKLDLNGNEIWWKSAPANDWNAVWSVRVVGDQLLGVGYKGDGGDRGDTRLISFNKNNGTILWDKSWGDNNQQGSGNIEILNGNVYVSYGDGVAWNSSAVSGGYSVVDELDTSGNLINTYKFDVPSANDSAGSLIKVGNSLYMLGSTNGTIQGQSSGGGYDVYIASVVVDPTQTPTTTKSQWLSYSGQTTDEWSGGIATFSNGDIATAFSVSKSNGASSVIVQRLNTNGVEIWSLDIGADYAPGAGSVLVGKDDKVYMVGGTKKGATGESGKNDSDVYAAAISSAGQRLWYKNYGIGIHEIGSTAVLDANGNIVLNGRVSEVNDAYTMIKDVPNFYGAEFSGGWRGFQLKINPLDGSVSKAYTTGSGNSGGELIAVDQLRNIVFVGGYTFGAVNGVNTVGNGDPAGANKYLIARNETSGSVLWTRMENWIRSNLVTQESEDAVYFVDKGILEKVKGSTGVTQWTKPLSNTDYRLSPIKGGGILLSETKSTGALTIRRFDSTGNESGSQVINHTGDLYPVSFIENEDGILIVSGSATGAITMPSGATIKTAKQAGSDAFVLQVNSSFSALNPVPTHTLTPSATTINEGAVLTSTASTTNVANGTKLYYALSGTGITSSDFSAGTLTGEGVTDSTGKFSFSHTLANDLLTEGAETLSIKLYSDTARTLQVGSTATVRVVDSSTTAPLVVRGNSLYTIVDGPSWTQAEANSVKLGGHLITLNNKEELFWVQDVILSDTKIQKVSYFTGLNDVRQEGSYEWSSGQRDDWSNVTDLIHRQNWIAQQHLAPAHDYTAIGWGDRGFRGDYTQEYRPDLYNNKFGTIGWVDNNNSWAKTQYGQDTLGISETPFIRRGDSAYVIFKGPTTWEEAEGNAVKLGGHLVTINDAAENEWIKANFSANNNSSVWIGFNDKAKEGSWVWSSGDPIAFTAWNSGEPDGQSNYKSSENAAQLLLTGGIAGKWQDIPNNSLLVGIAEIKLAPNSTPTGTPTLSGNFKAGQVITIDKTPIQDADNFTGYTPEYKYSWEVSSNGTTWTKLATTDASDNNTTYTLTSAEVSKSIRGVVSYVDGYGTQESVASTGSSVTSATVVRGNSLYTIVDGPSWTQAEANSVKLGGHLVTVNDVKENGWIASEFSSDKYFYDGDSANPIHTHFWLGGTDHGKEGIWTWTSGQVFSFDYFDRNHPAMPIPNNQGVGGYDYLMGIFNVTSDYLTGGGLIHGNGIGSYYWDDSANSYPGFNCRGITETPFNRRGDSAYVIVQGPTWEEAEANAVKLGGHLVTINDAAENDWIYQNFGIGKWIGLTDKETEGSYKWANGESVAFTNWAPGEPSNSGDIQDYAWIQYAPGIWDDLQNDPNVNMGIAEIKLAPNNSPTGTPTLSGNFKAGQVITIDKTPIQDADNFTGYTPEYKYSWEVSTNGTTWTKLTSTDATDNNTTYTLTTAEVGKQVRGVVSYLDGYGTNESVATAGSAVITNPSPTYTLIPSATSANEGSSISYTLTTTNVASGTSLYYQFSGTGINAADFSSATTTGTEVVGSNGQLTIARTLTADKTTEGTETLTLKVFTDSTATTLLATNAAVTVNDASLTSTKPTQQVYTLSPQITYKPTDTISAPLLYTTSSGDANLSGLTLNVHYNSSILTPSGSNDGVSGQVAAAISSTKILADTNNLDNDPLTDKILQLLWATFDNSFPSKTLPASLATVSFDTSAIKLDPVTGQALSTTVRYTASETAPNYDFLTGSTIFKPQQFNLDVDGDGKVTALGDGLMVIRKLFGAAFAGDALTAKARSNSGTRTTAEIHEFIQQGIDGGLLDVDKDGRTTGLGDGLMIIRRLFGAAFDGGALTNKAINSGSPYFGQATDFNSVGINIDALKPTFI